MTLNEAALEIVGQAYRGRTSKTGAMRAYKALCRIGLTTLECRNVLYQMEYSSRLLKTIPGLAAVICAQEG